LNRLVKPEKDKRKISFLLKPFSWLAFLLLTSIFVLSCIPEDSESLLKKDPKEIVDSEILFAKEWFETNKTNLVNNQSWQSARLN